MRASTLLAFLTAFSAGGLCLLHGFGFMAGFNTTPLEALTRLVPPTHAAPTPRPAGRVWVVVVDGLRADFAAHLGLTPPPSMPTAACQLETVLPSFSRPAYVTLSTGVPPWASGVHTNDHEGAARLPSIWEAARRAGIRTHLVSDGTDWWVDLFPHAFDAVDIVPKQDFDAFWRRRPPLDGLALVHLVAADDAGHDFGVESGAYRDEVVHAGRIVQSLLAELDAQRDTLIVTADHGHIARGGHGGPEPEVLAIPLLAFGAGVTPSPLPASLGKAAAAVPWCGVLADLPVAIAARLGLPPPVASFGSLLPIIMPRDDAFTHALTAQSIALHDALGAAGYDPVAQARARPASVKRMLLGFGAWALLALLLGRFFVGPALRVLISAFLPATLFAVVYMIFEPTLSLSAVWLEDPWTLRLGALAAATGLVASLVVFRRHAPAEALVATTLGALLPLSLALSAHGAFSAGPVLGEAHAAFAIVLGDLFAAAAAGAAVLVAVVAFARDKRRERDKVWV